LIVIDTNVVAYLFLQSDRSDQAERVLLRDSQWAAPLLWRSEMRNVLTNYVRNKVLTLGDAQQIIEEAISFMHNREYEVGSLQVLSLAASSACSAYDCEFVALAQALETPLITVDRQIIKQFPAIATSLEDFASD
jgi:predicted nucleic acid-binding protein